MKTSQTTAALAALTEHIRAHGPIETVRVSSARGATVPGLGGVPYWGAVRYRVRLQRDGYVTATAQGLASSDRRARRLAVEDARQIAEDEGRILIQCCGRVSEAEAAALLREVQS